MKFLNKFLDFSWMDFEKEKRFLSIGIREWIDFDTKEHLGTKIDAVITKDSTDYGLKDGEVASNIYEKLTFKVPKDIDVAMNVEIKPKNVKASVYGEYRNQLSIIAEDVVVVGKKEA